MPSQDTLDLLQKGVASLGLALPPAAPEQFLVYLTELKRWNARVNLTALRTDRDIVLKHFRFDCCLKRTRRSLRAWMMSCGDVGRRASLLIS